MVDARKSLFVVQKAWNKPDVFNVQCTPEFSVWWEDQFLARFPKDPIQANIRLFKSFNLGSSMNDHTRKSFIREMKIKNKKVLIVGVKPFNSNNTSELFEGDDSDDEVQQPSTAAAASTRLTKKGKEKVVYEVRTTHREDKSPAIIIPQKRKERSTAQEEREDDFTTAIAASPPKRISKKRRRNLVIGEEDEAEGEDLSQENPAPQINASPAPPVLSGPQYPSTSCTFDNFQLMQTILLTVDATRLG